RRTRNRRARATLPWSRRDRRSGARRTRRGGRRAVLPSAGRRARSLARCAGTNSSPRGRWPCSCSRRTRPRGTGKRPAWRSRARRLEEGLHVGPPEQHRRLRVPRENRALRELGQEELEHGREALDVGLLVDDEVEIPVGDEGEIARQQVVAPAVEPLRPEPPLL